MLTIYCHMQVPALLSNKYTLISFYLILLKEVEAISADLLAPYLGG